VARQVVVGATHNVTVIANATLALDPPSTVLFGAGPAPTAHTPHHTFAVAAGRNVTWALQLLTVGGAAADAHTVANYVTILLIATRLSSSSSSSITSTTSTTAASHPVPFERIDLPGGRVRIAFSLTDAGEYNVVVTVSGTELSRRVSVVPGTTHPHVVGTTLIVGDVNNGTAPERAFSAADHPIGVVVRLVDALGNAQTYAGARSAEWVELHSVWAGEGATEVAATVTTLRRAEDGGWVGALGVSDDLGVHVVTAVLCRCVERAAPRCREPTRIPVANVQVRAPPAVWLGCGSGRAINSHRGGRSKWWNPTDDFEGALNIQSLTRAKACQEMHLCGGKRWVAIARHRAWLGHVRMTLRRPTR
jgi:hypothetical protein